MSVPQLYSLGKIAIDSAFYADCPLSKNALSKVLNKSRPTVWRYEGIAYYSVQEFKEDYPRLPKELWLVKKSKHDRTVLLSPYQSWVISIIKTCQSHLGKKSAVQQFVKENQYLFSKNNYHLHLAKLAKIATAVP